MIDARRQLDIDRCAPTERTTDRDLCTSRLRAQRHRHVRRAEFDRADPQSLTGLDEHRTAPRSDIRCDHLEAMHPRRQFQRHRHGQGCGAIHRQRSRARTHARLEPAPVAAHLDAQRLAHTTTFDLDLLQRIEEARCAQRERPLPRRDLDGPRCTPRLRAIDEDLRGDTPSIQFKHTGQRLEPQIEAQGLALAHLYVPRHIAMTRCTGGHPLWSRPQEQQLSRAPADPGAAYRGLGRRHHHRHRLQAEQHPAEEADHRPEQQQHRHPLPPPRRPCCTGSRCHRTRCACIRRIRTHRDCRDGSGRRVIFVTLLDRQSQRRQRVVALQVTHIDRRTRAIDDDEGCADRQHVTRDEFVELTGRQRPTIEP